MQKGKGGYGGDLMDALFHIVAAAKGGWKGGGGSKAGRSKGKGGGKGAEGKGAGARGKGQGSSGFDGVDPEWPCPKCGPGNGTRNRQNRTHCRACGAPRPHARGQPKGGVPGPARTPPAATRPTGVDGRRPILGCRDSSWKSGGAATTGFRAPNGPARRETERQRGEPLGRDLAAAGGSRSSTSYATMAAAAGPAGKGGARDRGEGADLGHKGFATVDYGKGIRPKVGRYGPLAEEEEDEDPSVADQEEQTGDTEYHDMADHGGQRRQQSDRHDDADHQQDDDCGYGDDGGQAHDDDADEDDAQDAVEQAKEELEHRQEIHRCIRNSRGRNHPATIRARRDVEEAQRRLAEARGPRKWWVQVRKHERRLEAIDRAEERLEEEWQKAEELFQQQAYDHQVHQQAMQEKFDDFKAERAAIRADLAAIKRQPLDAHHDADGHEQPSQECTEAKLKVKLMGEKIAGILEMVQGNHKVHQELAAVSTGLADLENLVGDSAWWYDEGDAWNDGGESDADDQRQRGGGGGSTNRWSGGSRAAQDSGEADGGASAKGLDEVRPMEVSAGSQTTGVRRPAASDSQSDRGGKQAKCAEQRATEGSTSTTTAGAPSPAAAAAQRAAEAAAAQAAEAAKEARRQRAMDALRARLLAQQQKVLEAQQQAANVSASQAHARTEQQLEEMARQIEALNNEVAAQAEREWEALSAEAREELLEQYA